MVVIRGSNKDHIQVFGMVFKQLSPIGVTLRLAPAFLLKDTAPARLVHFGEGHALAAFLVSGFCVRTGAAANGNKANLQLLIEALRSDDAGDAERGRRTECGRSFYKLTT